MSLHVVHPGDTAAVVPGPAGRSGAGTSARGHGGAGEEGSPAKQLTRCGPVLLPAFCSAPELHGASGQHLARRLRRDESPRHDGTGRELSRSRSRSPRKGGAPVAERFRETPSAPGAALLHSLAKHPRYDPALGRDAGRRVVREGYEVLFDVTAGFAGLPHALAHSPRLASTQEEGTGDQQWVATTHAACLERDEAHVAATVRVEVAVATACGHRPKQEDCTCVVPDLLGQAHPGGEQQQQRRDSMGEEAPPDVHGDGDGTGPQAVTYVGVFDGHNGIGAAQYAANHLHEARATRCLLALVRSKSHLVYCTPPQMLASDKEFTRAVSAHLGHNHAAPKGADGIAPLALASRLVSAFHALDDAVLAASAAQGSRDGSTALVALRCGQHVYTAHVGDSRAVAVLARAQTPPGGDVTGTSGGAPSVPAVRLTRDHTASCGIEAARVRAAGGSLHYVGCWRVIADDIINSGTNGGPSLRAALAVTRALGDAAFKRRGRGHLVHSASAASLPSLNGPHVGLQQTVLATPDVARLHLKRDVVCVVCATDGLWDALSDDDAAEVAHHALATCLAMPAAARAQVVADALIAASLEVRVALDVELTPPDVQ